MCEYLYQATVTGKRGSFCAGVVTNEFGNIIDTAPILKKFRGQHIKRLQEWLRQSHGTLNLVGHGNPW